MDSTGTGTDHVVTGCTGFVGGHLLARLLADPTPGVVHGLGRSTPGHPLRRRVERALEVAGFSDADKLDGRLVAIEAELTAPSCGVGDLDLLQLTRRSARRVFWHVAASLRWERGQRAKVFETNVTGTENALKLATRIGADLFVHVSTAYTCGTLDGDVPEALHSPPGFNNVYEESKNAAEHLVYAHGGPPRAIIVRPSIIVGTSHDYRACGSYTGLYGFLTELRRFKAMLGDSDEVVRLTADRDAVLSFIPVDHVITDMMAVVHAELSAPSQPIHHVTGDLGPRLGEIADYTFDRIRLSGRVRLIDGELDAPSPLERFFARRMEFFSGYLKSTKRFARAAGVARSMTLRQMTRYIDSELADAGAQSGG